MSQFCDQHLFWQLINTIEQSVLFPTVYPTPVHDFKISSATNPWTICVDTSRPKRNLIFDIVYVQCIEQNSWAREGANIQVEIGANNREFWSACIEPIDKYPGTCIIIRGQLRSSAYDHVESYYQKNINDDLKAVHQKAADDFKNNPARLSAYYQLIFPEDLPLDNVILSGNPDEILKSCTGVRYSVGNNTDCSVVFINWKIAKKGAGHKIETLIKEDVDDLFT